MALFELEQDFGSDPETEWKAPTFKDCAAADIDLTFFEQDEHADLHTVDGKEALVIVDDQRLKEHNSHWEAGAKQNFDTGLWANWQAWMLRRRRPSRPVCRPWA